MLNLSKKKYPLVLSILVGLTLWHYFHVRESATSRDFKVSVQLATVKQNEVVNSFDAIGTIKSAQGIDVSSSVAGIVESIQFTSGQAVKQGQVLLTLKNDDLKALIVQDQSKYTFNKNQYQRYEKLAKQGVVPCALAEQIQSNMQEAKAQLDHDEALLNNTIITAPFSGVLGVSQVSPGQYITPGKPIVPIQDLSTLYVDFYIPEKVSDLVRINRPVVATSKQSNMYQWKGAIQAVSPVMDNETRSLLIRAQLNPPYSNLVPGMYVNVTAAMSDQQSALEIPQQAIVYGPDGYAVYVYQHGKVFQRAVDLGNQSDDMVVIKHGLQANEQVVIAGQQKLYNGALVRVER